MSRFVAPFPDPDAPENDIVLGVFAHRGLERHGVALADLFRVSRDGATDEVDDAAEVEESVLEHVAAELCQYKHEQPTLVLLRATLVFVATSRQFTGWTPDPSLFVTHLVAGLTAAGVEVSNDVATLLADKKAAPLLVSSGILAALVTARLVDPARFLDVDAIRTTKKLLGGTWNQQQRDRDPGLPDFWVVLDAARTIESCESLLSREPIETLGALAWGMERSLEIRYPGRAGDLYPLLGPIAQLLCRRRHEAAVPDRVLTRCCWFFGRFAGTDAPTLLREDYAPLRELALSELGRMRSALRADDAASSFAREQDYLVQAAFYVLHTDSHSLWDVLRRLLLALRELPRRAVPLDLRTWEEAELEPVPQPWGWVPNQISNILALLLGRELKHDEKLHELRRNLGKFCVDRLKTRDKRAAGPLNDAAFVEPDPNWRAGYAHAYRALRPSLSERERDVLAWSQHHDPDESVREAAKLAHEATRRGRGLPENTSPRHAVFAAFWWLRQAHVLALGESPDERGAQRTYRKEMRRQADNNI